MKAETLNLAFLCLAEEESAVSAQHCLSTSSHIVNIHVQLQFELRQVPVANINNCSQNFTELLFPTLEEITNCFVSRELV